MYEQRIARKFNIVDRGRPADKWLNDTVRWAWRTRVQGHLAVDLRMRLWQAAEDEAVRVFASNLRDLLLAAPAGTRATMGLDPGFRTGVKVAVVDATGKVAATTAIYPHEPKKLWTESLAILGRLCKEHKVELIAIGNGTASRETDKLAAELIALAPELKLTKIVVSEAGASVYSASAYASAELPDMDVSLRGAVSIARRLQDPLAELVKIDPEIHRRRPISARRDRVQAVALARRGGGRLRERGRRGREHRFRAAARARVRHQRKPRQEHRRPSRQQGRLQEALRASGSAPAWAESLRAGGRLPAHPQWRRSAGRLLRASRGLSRGAQDREGGQDRYQEADRQRAHPARPRSPRNSRTKPSGCRP